MNSDGTIPEVMLLKMRDKDDILNRARPFARFLGKAIKATEQCLSRLVENPPVSYVVSTFKGLPHACPYT